MEESSDWNWCTVLLLVLLVVIIVLALIIGSVVAALTVSKQQQSISSDRREPYYPPSHRHRTPHTHHNVPSMPTQGYPGSQPYPANSMPQSNPYHTNAAVPVPGPGQPQMSLYQQYLMAQYWTQRYREEQEKLQRQN